VLTNPSGGVEKNASMEKILLGIGNSSIGGKGAESREQRAKNREKRKKKKVDS
jgi:hypothetical protein